MAENRKPGAASEEECLNCGTDLQGRYCHECGQKASRALLPLSMLFRDVFQDVFGVDSKFYRTFVMLVRKPGQLTVEYVNGHRARYTAPIRLYLIMSFLFFLLSGLSTNSMIEISEGDPKPVAPIALGGNETTGETVQDGSTLIDAEKNKNPSLPLEEVQKYPPENSSDAEVEPDFQIKRTRPAYWSLESKKLNQALLEDPEGVRSAFLTKFRNSFIFLIPVFALMLKVLYIRKPIYYAQHFIFSLHLHSFGFFLSSIGAVADIIAHTAGLFSQLTLPFMLVYSFISLRKNYGQGRTITAIKLLVIFISYLLLGVACAIGALVLLIYSLS